MRYIPMLTLITLMSFFGCAKKFKADALPAKQLVFGTGGGFAGVEKRFILLENGQLFQQLGEATPKELQKMPKRYIKTFGPKRLSLSYRVWL